ncbi:hypothetical protein NGM33_28430 [Nocardiopsis dassonvillei]|uniref:hypothetical protein n=1 Tax=Nocardiopsis dassonvillei TaxID=2014 RepID=UPI0020A5C38B|nr:hypothetical protein [Nocardiopsis dassonvillei]MCP3017263.1 hypothetical protein [Nocardiopsis dassonvillei]
MSETAPDLCAARCPHGHDHTCARPPQHCGFHRDAEQKGDESCSWTDDDRPAVGPVYESPEELAAEIVRLREGWDRLAAEIPRLYGRETAADLPHDSEYVTALHDVLVAMKRIERGDATLTSTPESTPAPSLEERVRELEELTEAMSVELEAHSRALDGK